MSTSAELAQKLEKRNKINEGELPPPTESGTNGTAASETNNNNNNLSELEKKLDKRCKINEGEMLPTMNNQGVSVYSENPNLKRKTIQTLEGKFNEMAQNSAKKGSLNLTELKALFENLGYPQTHLTLKGLLRDAKQDPNSGALTLRDFITIFNKACSGELDEDSPLKQLAALNEINVGETGVGGAKEFFKAKMMASGDNSFAREVEQERAKKLQEEEDQRKKAESFKDMRSKFCA